MTYSLMPIPTLCCCASLFIAAPARVFSIDVPAECRRQGIATAMWEYAQGLRGVRKLRHSTDMTNDGAAWRASL